MKHPIMASLVVAVSLSLCLSPKIHASTLYHDLGGKSGIQKIVDRFLVVIFDDPRVVEYFIDTNIERFKEMFVTQLCSISNGPCEYKGDTMQRTHGGLDISSAEFNAVVEDLMTAMEDSDIPLTVQNRLLAKLAPLRNDIIRK